MLHLCNNFFHYCINSVRVSFANLRDALQIDRLKRLESLINLSNVKYFYDITFPFGDFTISCLKELWIDIELDLGLIGFPETTERL